MKDMQLETTDIFRGAFFLCNGGDLREIRVRSNGKPRLQRGRHIATFLITGHGLDKLDRDYRTGRALVNPVQLRESLNHLRDVLFETLRQHDPASSKRHAGAKERTRYDRKREDRGHKTWR